MYAEERQQAMARLVLRRGRMSVAELAAEYAVTTETVRRDLDALERVGVLRRVHGGAVPVGALSEVVLSERDTAQVTQKERIARAALALLPEVEGTLLLDAGTTTGRFASMLPRDRRLTVFTHAVPLAAQLAGQPNVELHVLPGRVRPTTHAAVGADTVAAIGRLRVDLVLLGANGVSPEHGLSTPDPEEAAVKRAMVTAGRRRVVLADSSKVGREDAVQFAELREVDVLLTDSDLPAREARNLRKAGPEVVVA
jgi:DeoR family transcriptional regulator, fructose operon transcriptional repressor